MDLEVLFACVLLDVDDALNNINSLIRHEMYKHLSEETERTVMRLFSLIKKSAFLLQEYPETFLQHVVNKAGDELSLKASSLLETRYKDII